MQSSDWRKPRPCVHCKRLFLPKERRSMTCSTECADARRRAGSKKGYASMMGLVSAGITDPTPEEIEETCRQIRAERIAAYLTLAGAGYEPED